MERTHQASAEDREFVRSFEALEFPPNGFSHRSHIRLAYAYLCEHDVLTTCSRIRNALCRFLIHSGIEPSSKYHETMTQAWVFVVRYFMTSTSDVQSASEFIEANPRLLDSGIIKEHYSEDVLFSAIARKSFVEPDLRPIPGVPANAFLGKANEELRSQQHRLVRDHHAVRDRLPGAL